MTRAWVVFAFFIGVAAGFTGAASITPGQAAPQNKVALISTEGGIIRFLIGGEEKARIDGAGLHVRGDLNYAGVITDTGLAAYAGEAPNAP